MAEQLYTIPINEAFEQKDGCPMCRLRARLEQQSLDYIMGAAMMEPDVRVVTNRLGFCRKHLHDMLGMGSRLSLALMLETRLQYLIENTPSPDEKPSGRRGKSGKKGDNAMLEQTKSCFVCARVSEFEQKYISNVVYIYKKDPEFPEKLRQQPYLCLEHAALLLEAGKQELSESRYQPFAQDILTLEQAYLASLKDDVTAFCRSFDHENAGKPLDSRTRYAVEHAVAFLSGDFDSDKA